MTDNSEKMKIQNIRKLIEISGAKIIATQSFFYSLKDHMEDPEIKEIIEREINIEQLVDDIYIKIYDKYFADSEIKELIKFYESPIGRKLLSLSPKLFQEAAIMGEAYIKEKLENYLD